MKIGQIIKDRYEILEVLGEGGMAFVYKAMDTQLERFVAIKTLKPNYVNQETFVDRFKREAKTAANLNHPNIVQIFDWGIEDEPYFVMEYIEGNTLTSIIAKNRGVLSQDNLERIINLASHIDFRKNHYLHQSVDTMWSSFVDMTKHRGGNQNLPVPTAIGSYDFIQDLKYDELEKAILENIGA